MDGNYAAPQEEYNVDLSLCSSADADGRAFGTPNGFTDEIIEAFSSLKELAMFDLWRNKLSGSIPVWISQHGKLEILYLYDNGLTEELSYNITTVNLIKIDLSANKLTGCIPEDFGTLKKITIIILYNNESIGPIPRSIDLIRNLQYIQLFDNMLSGEVPQELGKHSPLGNIEVYNKSLSSSLLEEIFSHGKLFNIVVSKTASSASSQRALATASYWITLCSVTTSQGSFR
ncbi:receptor-like protein 52 [Triticum aestivum]|uniref:receptor-like protein 52 n=1 Tax=Triticum aestivum TaxID=4565 RepID=UPI001D0203A0|nr:receptor-like protein 52 [Triticum aestivum]